MFEGFSRASFRGKWRPATNSPKIPGVFQCKIPRQIRGKNPQKFSGEQGNTCFSDFSSRPWRNFPHMGDPHGDPQTSAQHVDPHGLGAFSKKTIQEIHVDWRVVDWSAGRHVDHPCGWQIRHGLLESH